MSSTFSAFVESIFSSQSVYNEAPAPEPETDAPEAESEEKPSEDAPEETEAPAEEEEEEEEPEDVSHSFLVYHRWRLSYVTDPLCSCSGHQRFHGRLQTPYSLPAYACPTGGVRCLCILCPTQ